MKCPNCKTKNPRVTGRYGCTMIRVKTKILPRIFFIFECCGEHATKKDYLMSVICCMREIAKQLKDIKVIFKVCIPCQKGLCDCSRYDGIEKNKFPKGWKPHDDRKFGHNCYCTFEFKEQRNRI